jgi:hypothetical protein
MKGHEEDTCRFRLKAMQEAPRKTKKVQQNPVNFSEAFAIEQAEISEFSDVSENVKEMPEMQKFLDNMETEVCNTMSS